MRLSPPKPSVLVYDSLPSLRDPYGGSTIIPTGAGAVRPLQWVEGRDIADNVVVVAAVTGMRVQGDTLARGRQITPRKHQHEKQGCVFYP